MLLKRRAQEVVDLADKTEQEFIKSEDSLTGELSIGCGETLNMHILAQWIASFRMENPLVQNDIHSATADEIKERWGILAAKDSPFARYSYVSPADLTQTPLLIAKRNLVRDELRGWFGPYFDSLEIAGTYNLLYNAAVMAENGVGAVLCTGHDRTNENLCFIPLSPALETGAVLVWKKNQACSTAAARFFTHVQICAKRMTDNKI